RVYLEQAERRARPDDAVGGLGAAGDRGIIAVAADAGVAAVVEAVDGTIAEDGGIGAETAFPRPVERERDAFVAGRLQAERRAGQLRNEPVIDEQLPPGADVADLAG